MDKVSQFANMFKLNQILKTISGLYVIYNNFIYMKSIIDGVEKYAYMPCSLPEKYGEYFGYGILPNQFYQFGKNVKKKNIAWGYKDGIEYLYDSSGEYAEKLELQKLITYQSDIDSVKELCFTHFSTIEDMIMKNIDGNLCPYDNDMVVVDIETFNKLAGSKPATLELDGHTILITIQLIPTIKKASMLGARVLPIPKTSDKDDIVVKKQYLLLKEDLDIMDVYTLCAFYDF